MIVPEFLSKKYGSDITLASAVSGALAKTEHLISNAQPYFFPEYTDHGPQHNTDVLATAVDLMTDEAKEILSPADAAALTLSVLLHDCGMHLPKDSFWQLIKGETLKGIDGIDSETWQSLWDDFMHEARRFDGKKLTSLFGDAQPVETPPQDTIDFTDRHRMLIGEFLRRHHPRLAHEFAVFGIPSADGKTIPVLEGLNGRMANWVGMVARSHGEGLRKSVTLLAGNFTCR